ncbi:MAG TPA: hypothetical protein VMV94_21935 [Phycisphaerae bacterium]|nr:hypothetical protein [Phycisphaerae bacterium]
MAGHAEIPPQITLDAEDRVAEDLACIQCGYNLRTLHREAKCPECGLAVGRSLRGDWLKYSDPAWLKQVTRGLSVVVGTNLVVILCTLISAICDIGGRVSRSDLGDVAELAFGLTLLIGVVGSMGGLWLFTAPEPNHTRLASEQHLRRVVRILACVTSGMMLTAMLFDRRSPATPVLRPAAALLALTCFAALLIYIRRLALRIPSREEASRAIVLLISFLIVNAAAVGLVFAHLGGPPSSPLSLLGGAACCVDIAIFIACIALLNSFRRSLTYIQNLQKTEAREASELTANQENKSGA